MEECIFCKIGRGDIPSHKVYEDESSLAFLDIKPHTKGHTVLIPKQHGVRALDFEQDVLAQVMKSVKNTMQRLQDVLSPDGFNVGWNDGSAAGQVVAHLHIHIMPRWNNDGGGSQHSIINNPSDMNVEDVAKLFE